MSQQWIQAYGKLVYEPVREGGRKRTDSPWWLIVQIPNDIAEFYRAQTERHILNPPWATDGIKLQAPMWGTHITVLDGREDVDPRHRKYWKKYEDERVEFEYSPVVEQKWKFWFLPVKSEKLKEIRRELGLNDNYPFHITIGRMD